jgi:hypothetical protein
LKNKNKKCRLLTPQQATGVLQKQKFFVKNKNQKSFLGSSFYHKRSLEMLFDI